ncbi:MAG: OprD family outer membrane porin [Arcticibacter sp.]
MRRILIIAVLSMMCSWVSAQEQSATQIVLENDSNSLRSHIVNAKWQVQSRSFFMSTINEGALKDDYTLATGAGMGMLTEPYKGFQLGMNGFFIFELLSSDIIRPDPLTNLNNRYELGMYDVTQPGKNMNLSRLEELYLKYSWKSISATIGRININTPFMNVQDGRMRPTLEEGVWGTYTINPKVSLELGWIRKVLPRSTNNWYSIASSLGTYNVGVNESGLKSGYAGNINSKGFGILHVKYNPIKNISIHIWDGVFENVMNTVMIELKTEQKGKSKNLSFYQGLMLFHQDALVDGGNSNQLLTYMEQGARSNTISIQAGLKNQKLDVSMNYTRITSDGRYLMPREWGREFFYTFMPRERNEGAGDVHAFMAKAIINSKNKRFKNGMGYGYYKMPDVKNYRLNKYGMPSYHQWNMESTYKFDKFLKGFEIRTLLAWKINAGETYDNPRYYYNKTDMFNMSIILDFRL